MHHAEKWCSPDREDPWLRRQLVDWATAATIMTVQDLLRIGMRRDQRMEFTQNPPLVVIEECVQLIKNK
jgi:hypothetical protein